jgi:hypothetical protein
MLILKIRYAILLPRLCIGPLVYPANAKHRDFTALASSRFSGYISDGLLTMLVLKTLCMAYV